VSEDGGRGRQAIHYAAWYGRARVARLLLAAKAATSPLDATGRAPLHLAARNGHADVIRVLLEARADPELPDREGHTAMYVARRAGKEGCAQALLLACRGLIIAHMSGYGNNH